MLKSVSFTRYAYVTGPEVVRALAEATDNKKAVDLLYLSESSFTSGLPEGWTFVAEIACYGEIVIIDPREAEATALRAQQKRLLADLNVVENRLSNLLAIEG